MQISHNYSSILLYLPSVRGVTSRAMSRRVVLAFLQSRPRSMCRWRGQYEVGCEVVLALVILLLICNLESGLLLVKHCQYKAEVYICPRIQITELNPRKTVDLIDLFSAVCCGSHIKPKSVLFSILVNGIFPSLSLLLA